MRTLARNVSLALVGALLVTGAAFAQTAGAQRNPEEMLKRQMTQLKSRLKLSDDQEKQVRPIIQENIQKMVEIRDKYRANGGPSPEMRDEMGKVQQDTTEKLGKVLSKDQMDEYAKMQEERRNRFRQGGRRSENH